MTISEMHVWFRQYAQQMGMQNVRALLPEQIDVLINTSITDTVNEIVRTNVGVTNDRVVTDNSKIGSINALRSIYKVKEVLFTDGAYKYVYRIKMENKTYNIDKAYITIKRHDTNTTVIYCTSDDSAIAVGNMDIDDFNEVTKTANIKVSNLTANVDYIMFDLEFTTKDTGGKITIGGYIDETNGTDDDSHVVDISVNYNGSTKVVTTTESTLTSPSGSKTAINTNYIFNNDDFYSGLIKLQTDVLSDAMFYVDFSVQYGHATSGIKSNAIPVFDDTFKTNVFPIRLIEDSMLADTLNDFVLKPRLRSPVMVIYNNNLAIYFGKLLGNATNGYFLESQLAPLMIRMSYIGYPAKVKFSEDTGVPNVDCDLPEYMHVDILKHAVDLYRQSVSGGIDTQRNSDAAQQRENVRNNYRNEDYQQ